MALADSCIDLVDKFAGECGARVLVEGGSARTGDLDPVIATENPDDSACKLPQEAAQAVERQAVEIDKDAQVARAQLLLHLVQRRGLASPTLTVQDDDVVTMASSKGTTNKREN